MGHEVAVVVDFGVEEEDGDHLFDPRPVEGQAALEVLLAIDVVQRDTWCVIVRCRIQTYAISAGSRAT